MCAIETPTPCRSGSPLTGCAETYRPAPRPLPSAQRRRSTCSGAFCTSMADGWESRNPTGRRGAEPLVAVEHLGKRYGPYVAIENVSLALHAGEILGLVGANGSGKTTMLRLLAGILRADQGYREVLCLDLRDGAAQIRSR